VGYLVCRGWPEQEVRDLAAVPRLAWELAEETERERYRDAWRESLLRRMEAKKKDVEAVVAGHHTGQEGGVRVRELWPWTPDVLAGVYAAPAEYDQAEEG
jgi:hypothetical protein